MANGWALQSGTSHFLGRNFAKAFDATFTDENGGESLVWGTSWGVSCPFLREGHEREGHERVT